MSFMIKIAFVLPTLAAAVGLGSTTSAPGPAPTPTDQAAPVLNRVSCDVCAEIYSSCLDEGVTPAGCQRLAASCYKNCL